MIAVLAFYFAADLFFSVESFRKVPESKMKMQEIAQPPEVEDASFLKKAAAYYLEQVGKRNIFKMGRDPVKGVSKKVISVKLSELSKSLRLVGVSWSENPDVMIEDTRAMRTFFVKRGEMVGELRVEAIFKDRVILSYAGEEIELK